MDFDLKYFREKVLNMTQAEFADVMGKSQNTVSRWEKEPQNLTLEVLAEISANTGFSLGDILNFKSKIHDPWKGEVSEMEKLRALKSDTNAKLTQLKDYMAVNSNSSQIHKNYADKLKKIYENTLPSIRKPRVGFLGNSDVGKSTLINAMIGQDVLPAGWTPITSLLIYVVHTEDRPDFLGDDSVVILSNRSGNKSVDIEQLHDENYFEQCSIESGGINVLEKYGSREGEYYMNTDATAAVVYIEAPLLKLCTLLDLPGFATSDNPQDDIQAAEGKNNADILVYMSLANGFMRGNDISYLKEVLDSLNPIETKQNGFEPLSNLFVVASQAHVVAGKEELRNILEKGAERMDSVLPENYWVSKSQQSGLSYEYLDFSKRFFTYSRDDSELSNSFKEDFISLLEKIPKMVHTNTFDVLQSSLSLVDTEVSNELDSFRKYIEDKESAAHDYHVLLGQKDEVYKNSLEFIKKLESEIELYKVKSIDEFKDFYDRTISTESIVKVINRKGFKNRKKDKEELQNYLNNTLVQKSNDLCVLYSNKLRDYLDKELNKLNISAEASKINFDYQKAFITGLAGLGTYGALAFYIGTLGNLGGYIVVAQAVGLLSSLGISVGGGAAATSFVASIGGPITIVLGISILIMLATAGILSGRNWKEKFADSLIDAYKKAEARQKYCTGLEKWWAETATAVNKNTMAEEYEKHLQEAEEKANLDDTDYEILISEFQTFRSLLIH